MEISIWNEKKDLCCLRCGSDQTQNLAYYVQTGTVSNDGFALVTDTRSSLRGPLVATTHSRSLNVIAKANPPPSHAKPLGFLILGILFALPALALSPFVSLALIGLGIYGMTKAEKYNREIYPEKSAEYVSKWICHRCGAMFVPRLELDRGTKKPAQFTS